MNEKKKPVYAVATVLSLFAMGQIPGSIDAAISKIAEAFQLSSTTALYVTTVASLASVVFSLVTGYVAGKKIGYRKLIILCAAVELIGALLPFFATGFPAVLVMRAFFGIGFGGIMSMENTVASLIIPEEKRPGVLGMAMFCGFGANCLLQFVGGLLADKAWNYVFLTHLFLLIPFVIILICCPKMESSADLTKSSVHEGAETKKNGKLNAAAVGMSIVMMVVGILIAPLLIGCSFLSARIIDSATVAGIVAVCFSFGCMVGGISFSRLYGVFKRHCISVFLLVAAVGLIGCALTRNIMMLCILIFVSGFGFSLIQSSIMMVIGLVSTKNQVSMASALMMSLFNLGMFFSGLFEKFVGVFTGDVLYSPLYIGALAYLVMAVLLFIRSPFPNKTLAGALMETEGEQS